MRVILPSLVGEEVIEEMVLMASGTPRGCFVEVGVFQGGTAARLAELAEYQAREIFLYDTFEGMPYQDPIDSHPVGDLKADYESVRDSLPYAKVVKGIFPDSAVNMPSIAFVHLDCDQYRSVRESSIYLIPRMAEGGVIWFDDSTLLEGAKKAVTELFGDRLKMSKFHRHYVTF